MRDTAKEIGKALVVVAVWVAILFSAGALGLVVMFRMLEWIMVIGG